MNNDDQADQVKPKIRPHAKIFDPVSLTEPDHGGATDINTILATFKATGIAPPGSRKTPMYGDFTQGGDYFQALTRVRAAEEEFLRLPPQVRELAGNSVEQYLDMLNDPESLEALQSAGLEDRDIPPDEPPSSPSMPSEPSPDLAGDESPA